MRRGASLIELAVVAAALATIAVIAITSYQKAQDRTVENITAANLQAAATAQLRHAQTRGRYALTTEDIQSLSTREITFTTGPSTRPSEISISVAENGSLLLAARARSGACILLRVSPQEQDVEPQNLGPVQCLASRHQDS